ncbi:LysR family transcriptional regulator, partial [Burkholderia pseudomallei]
WFDAHGITPRIVGEFEDSALMALFAARRIGVFAISDPGAGDVSLLRGLRRRGRAEGGSVDKNPKHSNRRQHLPLQAQVQPLTSRFD